MHGPTRSRTVLKDSSTRSRTGWPFYTYLRIILVLTDQFRSICPEMSKYNPITTWNIVRILREEGLILPRPGSEAFLSDEHDNQDRHAEGDGGRRKSPPSLWSTTARRLPRAGRSANSTKFRGPLVRAGTITCQLGPHAAILAADTG